MPFIKKRHTQDALTFPSVPALFVGRSKELLFFVQQILQPEEPSYNILSIWGQGGVGKTTLMHQFASQAAIAGFKDSCMTALVDERQATPASMMEQFARQFPLSKGFEKALSRYKEGLQMLPLSRPKRSLHQTMVTRAPDVAGALVEGIPVAGPLLREGAKAATEHLLDRAHFAEEPADTGMLDGPLETLTRVFVSELNQLVAAKGRLPSKRIKRARRILLFFDSFELVADEAVPWLLHSVLQEEIHPNIVFILSGRDPLERSTAIGPKPWLPYYESQILHALPVHPFTQEETAAYLVERGITEPERIETIWHLSGGLPLYLGLLASHTQGTLDPTKDVVDNFLHRIPQEEQTRRQLALDAALFSRPFNLDDLEAFPSLMEGERPALYAWLLRQSFVRPSSLPGRFVYHEIAQELFQRYIFQHSPKAYDTTRRTLATYYQHVLLHLQTVHEKNQYGPSEERLDVMLALATQRFALPDEESHLQALFPLLDIFEYADIEQGLTLLGMLRKTVKILTHTQAGSHAHQVAQLFLRCLETQPTQFDQTYREEWRQACDHLLFLIKQTSSPELLAHFYEYCGWGYRRLEEHQQALTWFERALALDPDCARIQNGLGFAHGQLKHYQQALDHFNRGIELAPHHPYLYVGRGRMYARLGTYQQALRDCSHAIELDRKCYIAYTSRARIYMRLKDYRKALTDWDWLEASPEHPRAGTIQFQRGCAHLWLKDLAQALTCFTRSSELACTQDCFSWAQDYVLWARAWALMCQTPPGLSTLQHLQAIATGDHYTASVSRGVIFFLQKEFGQALTALQHATTLRYDEDWHLEPWADFWREWDAPFWLAMTYLALDQEEEARSAIAQALAREMPPVLLKPLCWFEQENPERYEQVVKPLFETYEL
ncbi:MAG TPA: tetratricopeptide repeat protein [Ktedonosporobacter sp.]|nr:tetratricopeptide repeat protein [Ktedonosporobacter sp.]